MRNYEMMTIIKPELTEDAVLAVADRVSKLIESQQGESITVNKWGRRKLAYPINKISEGFYILFNFAAEVKSKEEIDRKMKLDEDFIRHMIIRPDAD